MARLLLEQSTHSSMHVQRMLGSLGSPSPTNGEYQGIENLPKDIDFTAKPTRDHGIARKSPKRQSESPCKAQSRSVATGKTQRVLKPINYSTLSLNPKSAHFSPPGKSHPRSTRSSPQRTVKNFPKYQVSSSPSSLASSDGEESEWDCSSGLFDDESYSEDNSADELPINALRTPRRLKTCIEAIDLTDSESEMGTQTISFKNLTLREAECSSGRSSSSSCDIDPAIFMRFSPPQLKAISRKEMERPQRPITPPIEPSSPTKSRLTSPKKGKRTNIPPTPHRESIDAFWSQEVINTWNDEYSPRKTVRPSPKKLRFDNLKPIPLLNLSPNINPTDCGDLKLRADPIGEVPEGSPSKSKRVSKQSPKDFSLKSPTKTAAAEKKAFNAIKHDLATSFLHELDSAITNGQVNDMTTTTGGVQMIWSNKLISTAGRANWRREAVRRRVPGDDDGSEEQSTTTTATTTYRHTASIELSTKIITTAPRLLNVVAHEFCHLANFMVSGVKDQPHGASFKAWAAKVSALFGDRGITVTTKHDYSVEFKYVWMCQGEDCGEEYARHSKSIDVERMRCGRCKGRLRQVRPVPRGGNAIRVNEKAVDNAAGPGERSVKKSEYQLFVSRNFRTVKDELGPKSPMKDVMKELGSRYREQKNSKLQTGNKGDLVTEEQEVARTFDEHNVVDSTRLQVEEDVNNVARVLDFLTVNDD